LGKRVSEACIRFSDRKFSVPLKIDNAKWYASIVRNCKRFNLIHGRLFKDEEVG